MVEGADQGSMAGLVRRLARLDLGRLRFHDFPLDHAADLAGVQRPADGGDRGFTLTLWMRLVGATASGWLANRIGRKKPLMVSIAWYSACNFIAAFSPAF